LKNNIDLVLLLWIQHHHPGWPVLHLVRQAAGLSVTAIGLYTILVGSSVADSNPPEWLHAWEPQLALLSVASGDRRA
jgi:hypothetical protein